MGMVIFEQSGIFDPAAHGLNVGDAVQVVCVGGGQGGGIGYSEQAYCSPTNGGTSSFGPYITSASGWVMGRGGAVTKGADNSAVDYYPGSGAGGYLPGLPVFGGTGSAWGSTHPIVGLAGCYSGAQATISPYCNVFGSGNRGAGTFYYTNSDTTPVWNHERSDAQFCASGNGYGAGSSGWGIAYNERSVVKGGDSGKLFIGTHILNSLEVVPVTVGAGGRSTASYAGYNYTDYYCSQGAPGVVIVTW